MVHEASRFELHVSSYQFEVIFHQGRALPREPGDQEQYTLVAAVVVAITMAILIREQEDLEEQVAAVAAVTLVIQELLVNLDRQGQAVVAVVLVPTIYHLNQVLRIQAEMVVLGSYY